MKQVFIGRDGVSTEVVPAPVAGDGEVLVEVRHSLISTGTEVAALAASAEPPVRRLLRGPDALRKAADYVRRHGVVGALQAAMGNQGGRTQVGYSCAGVVIGVGARVDGIRAGDLVACAGAGRAVHAEVVAVPRNLVVRLPEGCTTRGASSVALGAIALQGVRRAGLQIGDSVAVIGLGLLGQITIQLVLSGGARPFGIDIDSRRAALSVERGAEAAFTGAEVRVEDEIRRLTDGRGVDVTLITASSRSDSVVQQAMEITRKKGRVVLVGDVGLGLKRSPFYEKEIDFLISCSYGPGRYDQSYEDMGLDYPDAYVRWSENRNMAEYLRLLARGRVVLTGIADREYPVDKAAEAYDSLKAPGQDRPLGVLLTYGEGPAGGEGVSRTSVTVGGKKGDGRVAVAVIGAGGFARATHLPNIAAMGELFRLRMVVDSSGASASAAAREFGAELASTTPDDAFQDPDVQAVIICTRHDSHARLAAGAARHGKAVLVEKPAALSEEELVFLESAIRETGVPFMVGYNRRFSPAAARAREILEARSGPLVALYRVNAGFVPASNWTQTAEGGGRIIGEGCHMLDFLQFLAGDARVVEAFPVAADPVERLPASDNSSMVIRYSDGSVATLVYTGLGASSLPKEYIEIYSGGRILVIDDFRSLRVEGARIKGWDAKAPDKGHREELRTFARVVAGEQENPLSLDQIVQTTRLSFLMAGARATPPAGGP